MKPLLALSLPIVMLALLPGCAIAPSETGAPPSDDAEHVDTASQAYIASFQNFSTWAGGYPYSGLHSEIVIGNSTSKLCYLTGLYGSFRGNMENVGLSVNAANNWVLSADSNGFTIATATCVNWSDFFVSGIGTPPPSSISVARPSGWSAANGGGSFSIGTQVPVWDHRSFCFLNGVGGAFQGGDESVGVGDWFGTGTYAPWYLGASATGDGFTHGSAMCASFNTGRAALYAGRELTWTPGNPDLLLAAPGIAACYLTGVSGNFDNGSNAQVSIYRDGSGRQYLNGGQGTARATARCLYYVQ